MAKNIFAYYFYRFILFVFVLFQFSYLFFYQIPQQKLLEVDSGTLITASANLSNSRLSYYAKISGAHNLGSSFFTIQSSSNPDNNTSHLFPRDTVNIGNNLNMTVSTSSAATTFSTTANSTSQLANGDPVTASQSAVHTITFTTVSAVTNPIFRVYIPAGTNTATSNDSGVDGGATAGFDLNYLNINAAANITCISNGTVSPQWGEYSATPSATIGNNLHAVECHYHGDLASGQNVTMTIGSTVKLINPAPKTGHTQGLADTYIVKIKQYQYPAMAEVDTVNVSVSAVEGVLVSATVNPSLSFQISGIAAGATRCGEATTVATTAMTVPFGELTGSDTFYKAAHSVSASTNAGSGYVIKIAETDSLKKPTLSTAIPDATCEDSPNNCTYTTTGRWLSTATTKYGWGYSLETQSGSPTLTFTYTSGSVQDNCPGSSAYCARALPNLTSVPNSQTTIATSGGAPTATQSFYTCYRLNYGPTQATGYYQTQVMYFPSAIF